MVWLASCWNGSCEGCNRLKIRSVGERVLFMFSVESWPEPAARAWVVAQRFQRFLMVGAVGLAVNQGLLFVFHDVFHVDLGVASPVAIFLSMIMTFTLNEKWTWHDRGTGPVLHRMGMYFPINLVGLLINFGILSVLVHRCLLYTSPSPRDGLLSRMPSSA